MKKSSSYYSEVRPKKFLGQHFLTDEITAQQIVDALQIKQVDRVIEVGPGMGVLTKYIVNLTNQFTPVELDSESVHYLKQFYPSLSDKILEGDILQLEWKSFGGKFKVIGNFPYNISTQILFKVLENRDSVVEVVGMFQKEVAQRITSGPGNKDYGILSVLLQAWYDCEYLFTVDASSFHPPPKVQSGVIRLVRNKRMQLKCKDSDFKKIVKLAFNQRRKTLRNSLKSLSGTTEIPYASLRPEQLSWEQFEELTLILCPGSETHT